MRTTQRPHDAVQTSKIRYSNVNCPLGSGSYEYLPSDGDYQVLIVMTLFTCIDPNDFKTFNIFFT